MHPIPSERYQENKQMNYHWMNNLKKIYFKQKDTKQNNTKRVKRKDSILEIHAFDEIVQ